MGDRWGTEVCRGPASTRGRKTGIRSQGPDPLGITPVVAVVPKRGLEPPRGCPHQTLNLACLPIPPLRRTPERGADVLEATWQVKAIPGTCRHVSAPV